MPFNLELPYLPENATDPAWEKVIDGTTVFSSNVAVLESLSSDSDGINITVLRKPDQGCNGTLEVETCVLQPGTVSIAIAMNAGNITSLSPSWRNDVFLNAT